MNKAELILEIQKLLGKDATKACAEKALNVVLAAIKAGVKKNKKLQLIGFGTFSVAERKARMGINPRTKAKIKIKASKVVKFKPGADFKVSKYRLIRGGFFGAWFRAFFSAAKFVRDILNRRVRPRKKADFTSAFFILLNIYCQTY